MLLNPVPEAYCSPIFLASDFVPTSRKGKANSRARLEAYPPGHVSSCMMRPWCEALSPIRGRGSAVFSPVWTPSETMVSGSQEPTCLLMDVIGRLAAMPSRSVMLCNVRRAPAQHLTTTDTTTPGRAGVGESCSIVVLCHDIHQLLSGAGTGISFLPTRRPRLPSMYLARETEVEYQHCTLRMYAACLSCICICTSPNSASVSEQMYESPISALRHGVAVCTLRV